MQITLDQKEIEKALVDFVSAQGISITDKHISVTLLAREELTAAINIVSGDAGEEVDTTTPKEAVTTGPADNSPDREVVKARLDKLGIEYKAGARTPTLRALLKDAEAEAADKKEEGDKILKDSTPATEPAPEQETGSLFGNAAEEPTKEEPPFDADDNKVTEEPVDEDKPLFGN